MKVKILTSINMKGGLLWQKNTVNIYEYFPFCHSFQFLFKIYVKVIRYLNNYNGFIALRLLLNRKKFDVIISKNVSIALTLALFSVIFRKKIPKHILHQLFLYSSQNVKSRIKFEIKKIIIKLLIKDIDYIRVNSSSEIIYYSNLLKIDKSKFKNISIPSSVLEPKIIKENEGYVFSGGKNFRDYFTLVEAIKDTGLKLIIVSDYKSMKKIKLYNNIIVYYNVPYEKYLELLIKSKLVVVPLNNKLTSCGQIVFLEAMSFGKPVIVTKGGSSIDYIIDGESGLLYEIGNYKDLRSKIILLNNNEKLRIKIASKAFCKINNEFNYNIFVSRYLKFIEEVVYYE